MRIPNKRAKRKVEAEEQRHPRSADEVRMALTEATRKKRRLEKTLKNAREPCTKLEVRV